MYRFFEIIPGLLSWITIILIVLLSWLTPKETAIFIILFDIYWLLKTFYLSLHMRSTFTKMRKNMKIDWLRKLTNDQQPITNGKSENKIISRKSLVVSYWSDIYHLIILPVYKEPYEVIEESFESLLKANYPKDKFIVVLAIEQQAGATAQEAAEKIQKEFGNNFFKFLITVHPANLPDEMPGKGSNETWAAREVKKIIIDSLKIPYENILASVFDVDTQIFPEYFGILTYNFLNNPRSQQSSYQPIPLFTNNIFQAPALSRVIAFSATFWQMIQQARPERLNTFSSHSTPFKALTEIGFWNTNIISEDSRIFWQCYLHYGGDWRAIPLNYPVAMDANVAPTFWKTMLNLYKQQRRWAWGSENIPYILDGFRKKSASAGKISWRKKLYWGFNIIEGFWSWSTNSLIIFSLGWLPLFLGGDIFSTTLLSYSLPIITSRIMTLAMLGLATSAVLSIALLPPRPQWFRKRHYLLYFLQWILMPFTLIIFGSIPALDAQTRLMLGGKFRLNFWVTPKHR